MQHSDFYKQYKELQDMEYEELKKAVLAHGGEFRFITEDGNDIEGVYPPIIMAGDRHWESNCDCVITRIVVNNDGYLSIYGYDKECSGDEILLDDIEFGHIAYIIDEIPETDDVKNVSTELTINEIPVVSLCRDDICDAGYNPDITNEDFQQIADRISTYLEWQEFFPQFLEDIGEACDYLNIPTLNEDINE